MCEADADTPLFLGVDAGGTKTVAVIVDADGVERGRAHAGSANLRTVGLEQTLTQIHQAVRAAADSARAPLPLAAAWCGVAGLHTTCDAEVIATRLRGAYAHGIRVSNDVDLVLSGLIRGIGVALVAGTGSIALAGVASGQRAQVGGWGHILGDEGSGYDIGRRGLQAAVRAADGRDAPTLLLDLVLQHWQLATPDDLVAQVYQHTSYEHEKARIGSLAPLVVRAAEAGDAAARRIVSHAAGELCLLAVTAIDAFHALKGCDRLDGLDGLDASAQPVSLAVGGGLLTQAHELRASVLARIRRRRRLARVTVVATPALAAARSLAVASGRDAD